MAQCPIHNKELKSGQYGEYCATKLADGTWCKYKPGRPANMAQAPAQPAPSRRVPLTEEQKRSWARAKDLKIGMAGVLQAAIAGGQVKLADITPSVLETVANVVEMNQEVADKRAGYDRAADRAVSAEVYESPDDEISVQDIPFN